VNISPIIPIYFFYGLAFFSMGLLVMLEGGRSSDARHRERIMHKLNMHSRTELVKFAIRTGLIQLH